MPFRKWDGPSVSVRHSPQFNRNKRSIGLDLAVSRRDRAAFESARRIRPTCWSATSVPRPSASLGLAYEQLSMRNPRLVYCSISGFGMKAPQRSGPDSTPSARHSAGCSRSSQTSTRPSSRASPSPITSLGSSRATACSPPSMRASEPAEARRSRPRFCRRPSPSCRRRRRARSQTESRLPEGAGLRRRRPTPLSLGDRLPFVVHLSSPSRFWEGLTEAIGQPELCDDPRFATRAAPGRALRRLRALLAEMFGVGTRETGSISYRTRRPLRADPHRCGGARGIPTYGRLAFRRAQHRVPAACDSPAPGPPGTDAGHLSASAAPARRAYRRGARGAGGDRALRPGRYAIVGVGRSQIGELPGSTRSPCSPRQ